MQGFLVAKAARVPTWDRARCSFLSSRFFCKRNGESFSWRGGLSSLISDFPRWSKNLLNCYWQAKNGPKLYIVIKWSWIPNHDSGCGLSGWPAKDFFCETLAKVARAKAVAKEKVAIEASSPHSTFAAASQGNRVNIPYLLVLPILF